MSEQPSNEQYIITESDQVSLLIKLRDFLLTVALWVIYIYFIRESWSFVRDFFSWAFNGFDDHTQYDGLRIWPMIVSYGQVAGVMAALYFGWAIYNLLRFRGRQRRKPRAIVAPEDLATMYGFSTETVTSWQHAEQLEMHHDDQGHISQIKILAGPRAKA